MKKGEEMKIVKAIFTIVAIIVTNQSFGQKNDIYNVKFKFHHSRRMQDHDVSVYFQRLGDNIQVYVKSMPKDTLSVKWKETKREYSFELNMTEFEKVVAAVKKINCSDITNGLGYSGFDGTTCEIEIGVGGSGITYKVWSPDYETNERNLRSFLDACKLILVTAKLDPQAIL